jgi:uncharacterized protein (DUF952 family)
MPEIVISLAYKLTLPPFWQAAEREGSLGWHGIDAQDGYMHLSAATQVSETLSLYFKGLGEVILVEVALTRLPEPARLIWEPSRGADLFPHLYTSLPLSAVSRFWRLEPQADGGHVLPALSV